MNKLTHLDEAGAASMVDVTGKADTVREAIAQGRIMLSPKALAAVRDGMAQKGDVLAVARVAGIMAAKKTSALIPLCHPLALSSVVVEFTLGEMDITAIATARLTGQTGVEMEALTAVSIALLTLYDMVKSIDKHMIINDIMLVSKSGGRSGNWRRVP